MIQRTCGRSTYVTKWMECFHNQIPVCQNIVMMSKDLYDIIFIKKMRHISTFILSSSLTSRQPQAGMNKIWLAKIILAMKQQQSKTKGVMKLCWVEKYTESHERQRGHENSAWEWVKKIKQMKERTEDERGKK